MIICRFVGNVGTQKQPSNQFKNIIKARTPFGLFYGLNIVLFYYFIFQFHFKRKSCFHYLHYLHTYNEVIKYIIINNLYIFNRLKVVVICR